MVKTIPIKIPSEKISEVNISGTFSKIGHMVGHKTSLNKFKKIEIISNTYLDHKGFQLETYLKEKNSKTFKYMETQ